MRRKRMLLFLMCACFILSVFQFAGCSGGDNAMHISTPEDLLLMANGGKFVLDYDIDCGGLTLNTIRIADEKALTVNGNGHVIKNVRLHGEDNCFGLISSDGNVKMTDLGIIDFTISTDYQSGNGRIYVGAFVSLCNDSVALERCYAKGSIDIVVKNEESALGGFVGCGASCEFTDCLSDVEIKADLLNTQFAKSTVYAGGFVGDTGVRNYGGYYRSTPFKHCINLSSIDIDTVLSVNLDTKVRIGGLGGFVGNPGAIECLSAPKYMRVSTFFLKNGLIGGIVGKTEANECSRTYYCTYYDNFLSDSERATNCSYYDTLNGSGVGTAVNLKKPMLFTETFLTTDSTFTDSNGNLVDVFLSFDKSVWSFGNGESSLPSLKCFDVFEI